MEAATDHAAPADVENFANDSEPVAWAEDASEADVVETAEAHHLAAQEVVAVGVVGADLGGGFAHDHARHERHVGHVAGVPKLVGREIAVADAEVGLGIVVDDRCELLHRVALMVMATDLFEVGNDVGVIDVCRVDNEIFATHSGPCLRFDLLTTVFTRAAVGWAFAVVGFFDFSTGLGHDELLVERAELLF